MNEFGVRSLKNIILLEGNDLEVCVSGTVKQPLSLIADWLYFGNGKSSRKQVLCL